MSDGISKLCNITPKADLFQTHSVKHNLAYC